MDIDNKIVGLPLSGGINSAAVAAQLIEGDYKPAEIHIFYAHFKEHSPGTLAFVWRIIGEIKRRFDNVFVTITYNSVLDYFREAKMIPHPASSPCSRILKIEPMTTYNSIHGVQVDLIGYVRTELSRIKRMGKGKGASDMFMQKLFPLADVDDEYCFKIVKKVFGFYPAIYDLRGKDGERLFKHNNCLPCKNMSIEDMELVATYYPQYMALAWELSSELNAYWGRNADVYYTTFGKEDYEAKQCEICSFD